jgi:hypothetical protein
MINVIKGIEGDDIPYQLSLLGYDVNDIPEKYFFFPLNDHYNTHASGWSFETEMEAKQHDVVVFYDLVNTGDYENVQFIKFVMEFDHPNKVFLTVNQHRTPPLMDCYTNITYDFMWNRIKSYYTEQIPESLYLHHYSAGSYKLPDLSPKQKKFKLMSLCGREYGYRTHLYERVKAYDGFISNRSRGIFLEGGTPNFGAYHPIPNEFYEQSCLSAYVESNCTTPYLIHITEKTFEPLIKGHFILPFSNPGTIGRLRTMGFQFPDFINYRYDTLVDEHARYSEYCNELARLMEMDLFKLHEEHHDMFVHNQQCIHTIPYDNRILKVFDV